MALNCEPFLTANIQRDCENNPVAGLEINIVILNLSEIDKSNTTFDTLNDLIITNLQCLSGKTGFVIEGVKTNTFASTFELVKNDYSNSYKHMISGAIVNPTSANKKQLEILAGGSKFVVVVQKKWRGENSAHSYEVYGYNNGLEGSTVTYNSKENNGVILFELSSEDGYEEPRLPYTFFDTDYATSATVYANAFAS